MRLATLGPHYTRAALHPGPPHAALHRATPFYHPFSLCRHPALLPGTRACTCSRWPTAARGTALRSTRTAGTCTCTCHAHAPPTLTPRPRARPPSPLPTHLTVQALPLPYLPLTVQALLPRPVAPPLCRRQVGGGARDAPAPHIIYTGTRKHAAHALLSTHQPYPKKLHVRSPLRRPRSPRYPPSSIPMMAGLLRQGGEGARAQGGAAG